MCILLNYDECLDTKIIKKDPKVHDVLDTPTENDRKFGQNIKMIFLKNLNN